MDTCDLCVIKGKGKNPGETYVCCRGVTKSSARSRMMSTGRVVSVEPRSKRFCDVMACARRSLSWCATMAEGPPVFGARITGKEPRVTKSEKSPFVMLRMHASMASSLVPAPLYAAYLGGHRCGFHTGRHKTTQDSRVNDGA